MQPDSGRHRGHFGHKPENRKLAAMVAEAAPQALRGSAFGVFNLAGGICILLASVIAGWLWDHHGASATFFVGAALAVAPLVMCCFAPRLAKRGG